MSHLLFLALLAACLGATAPLEVVLHTRVYARWPRLLVVVAVVVVVFGGWDRYAIGRGQWSYDRHWTVGVMLPGGLPLEELLFFVVIPTCAILTLEAVRSRRPEWKIGDEQ